MSARHWINLSVSALAAAWCVTVTSPPLLEARGLWGEAAVVRLAFDPVCHQIASRSIHLAGSPMAVCARCAGLYFGGLAGCLAVCALALLRTGAASPPGRWVLITAAAPSVVEWGLELAGLLEGASAPAAAARALTGLTLGFVVAFYLLPALEEMRGETVEHFRRLRPPMETTHAESG